MIYRVEIGLKPAIRDARGEKIKGRIIHDLNIPVEEVPTVDVYTLEAGLSAEEIRRIATGPFLDPIIQEYALDRPLAYDFDWAIEVGYKPGVTDNVGRTAREAAELIVHRKFTPEEGVYTSILYLVKGGIDRAQA